MLVVGPVTVVHRVVMTITRGSCCTTSTATSTSSTPRHARADGSCRRVSQRSLRLIMRKFFAESNKWPGHLCLSHCRSWQYDDHMSKYRRVICSSMHGGKTEITADLRALRSFAPCRGSTDPHTRAPQPVRGLWRQHQQPDAAVQTRPPPCNCNLPDPFCN